MKTKFELLISIKTKMIYLEPIKFKSSLTKSLKLGLIRFEITNLSDQLAKPGYI